MSHSFQFLIEQPDGGQRLDEFFASRFGSLSRMRIANLIEAGACVVNGAVGLAGYRILTGDSVEVSFDDGAPTAMSPEPIPLEVIHEDEHLIVVVKPAGMLVHPTMSAKTGTLANALAYHLNRPRIEDGGWKIENLALRPVESIDPRSSILNSHPVIRPGMVHRLDRATSGLIVIAKTPRALTVLSRHFRKRLVEKRYLALVLGKVEAEAGSINAPIGRDPDQRSRWRVVESGKPAETRFKVLERLRLATFLELEPVTGRTNQLRIHCAHIGHPIVGDEMHDNCGSRIADCGLKTEAAISDQATGEQQSEIRDPQSAMRLCLHAWKLAFHHPASGEWIEFMSPMPGEIAMLVALLRREQL
ncbi:MAG: RluA family pseudouridine synthase [Acidobacteriota bacterium]